MRRTLLRALQSTRGTPRASRSSLTCLVVMSPLYKFPLDVYGSFCHPFNDRFGLIQLTSSNTKFELVITKTPYQINNSRYLSVITSLHSTIHAYLMLIKSILSLTGLKERFESKFTLKTLGNFELQRSPRSWQQNSACPPIWYRGHSVT